MIINDQQLRSICTILADYNTHSEIDRYLVSAGIDNLGVVTRTTSLGYYAGDNKIEKLYKSYEADYLKSNNYNKMFDYIQRAAAPIQYTNDAKREKYSLFVESLNKVLLFLGCKINDSGKIIKVDAAMSLFEVDERVNHLKKELVNRKIHSQVMKYCNNDYLRKDYFDAVNEAVKGAFNRVREITGLSMDGCDLLNKAFSQKNPYLFFNNQKTESDWNEHNGLKEMMQALYHMVRNPLSHTPKINWDICEEKALDILTVVSLVHKYLDECYKIPNINVNSEG